MASVGASLPNDDTLNAGVAIAGAFEGYVTPRVSIRVPIGVAWERFKCAVGCDSNSRLWIGTHVVYNWEHGAWHPYVAAGATLYRIAIASAPESHYSDLKGADSNVGYDFGGGVERFVGRSVTVVGDGLYHRLGDIMPAPFGLERPGFWTISLGIKKYF